MSNVKLLNLDELIVVKRVVRIGGNEYPVAEQTLGEMLARIALSKEAKIDNDDPSAVILQLKRTAQQILPSAPESLIDAMTVDQIVKLIEFVNNSDASIAAKAEAADQEASAVEGKK